MKIYIFMMSGHHLKEQVAARLVPIFKGGIMLIDLGRRRYVDVGSLICRNECHYTYTVSLFPVHGGGGEPRSRFYL